MFPIGFNADVVSTKTNMFGKRKNRTLDTLFLNYLVILDQRRGVLHRWCEKYPLGAF